ncbi:unnamed protein product [Brachionus calyciflorus]|uniref:Cation-transporting P-type ATPase N-terminal domain-containing protein n=1 Tax=Brachionus calyciflorus TaxID=104777 RepID=A0A813TP37_9BILA|nr:unnamed protein product [Brachionus calyciflorus]
MNFKKTKIFPFDFFNNKKDYHTLKLDQIEKLFKTNFQNGLSSAQAQELLVKNGPNKIPISYSTLYLAIFRSLFGGFAALLWIATILCILVYKPLSDPANPAYLITALVILLVIFFQSFFISFQDWSSYNTMKSIQNLSENLATVIRDGLTKKIPSTDLVIGDIVLLNSNSKVPADIRLIEVSSLRLDKSLLTGESEQIDATNEKCKNIDKKTEYFESNNMAFMSCFITYGSGKGVVVGVGGDTLIGRISYLTDLKITRKKTLLQREMNRFSITLIIFYSFAVLIYILVWLTWLRVSFNPSVKNFFMDIFVIIISGVPFGLPVTISLALIIDSKKLKKFNILVKNLNAIEALSSVNVIASDKTGTLTQNKVHVVSVLLGLKEIDIGSCYFNPAVYLGVDKSILELLAICYLGNDFNTKNENSIDIALFNFSDKNLKIPKLEKCYKLLDEIRFNSKNKYHVKLLKPVDLATHSRLFSSKSLLDRDLNFIIVKGAPDILYAKCKWIIESNGNLTSINSSAWERLKQIQATWSTLGRRVILLCKKLITPREQDQLNQQSLENFFKKSCNDLCIVGMIGLIDPPRENLCDIVEKLRKAGIRILMCTGDYSLTAASIASQIGILSNLRYDTLMKLRSKKVNINPNKKFSGSIVLSGRDIDLLTKEEWNLICNKYEEIILARSSPDHKLRCIKELQMNGYIVGMTGDGVNDAPALKNADIGIAVGSGSEAALQAADIILLDNSFSYIVTSIENGRLLYYNIRKILLYLLPSCVFCQIISTLCNILVGLPMILSSYQMLIICILTDILPSIALIFEKPEENLMTKPPRKNTDFLVDKRLLLQAFIFLGPLMSFFSSLNFFLYFKWNANLKFSDLVLTFDNWNEGSHGISRKDFESYLSGAQTSAFVSMLIMQSFGNILATRTRYLSLFKSFPLRRQNRNVVLFLSSFANILFLLILVHIKCFNILINTKPIGVAFYALAFVYSMVIILADELRKLLLRKNILPKAVGW